jgi:hypothetical protein
MPDPFTQTDPLTQPYLGGTPAPQPPAAPKSVVGSMIAPGAPKPPAATAAPAQSPGLPAPAPQPQAQQQPQDNVGQFMQLVRTHESGGNDKASSGVADGRYQFTPATWAGVAKEHPELGLQPNDIWNGAKQDLAMRAISKDYVNVLTLNGIPPTMPNMFMLHFLGTGGGPKFLKDMAANPNANAAALFPTEAQYNPTIFHDKGGQPRSLQQVYALMTKTFGGPAASMAGPAAGEMKAIDSFDKASGVPTAARGFSDQMTASAGAQTSLEEMKLPPLLPGMKLDTSAKLPPLLPGMKLDYNSKEPLKQGAFTDKDGVYHPSVEEKKPDAPAPEVIGVDPTTGMPVFADPKLNAEEQQGETETAKGFAAGVAQDITGPASLLPNSLGGGYAEKANEYLDKTGDSAARTIGNLAPMAIPAGEIFGAAKAGSKALEAGESLLPSFGKAVGMGGATGALASSSNPTGKEGYGERLEAKAPGMAESGLVGSLISGAVPGVAGAAKWVGHEISDIFGWKVGKAADALRTGFDAATGKELTKEQIAAHAATIEEAAEKKVIEEQAQRKASPPEQAGADLQPVIQADRKAVMDRRRKESGFADAVKSDGGRPSINTGETTSKIADIEKRFDVDLGDLKSTLKTRPDVKGGETQQAVSIERGRHFVDVLNDKIEQSKSGPAHALEDIRDEFIKHMETTHPKLAEAREKYATLSRDVDPYERKGVLKKPSESDLYSKEPTMDPTKVMSILTNKTAQSGAAIKRLVDGDSTGKVKDTIRQHFNYELWGGGKEPTVANMDKLLGDRRIALENSGLFKEFEGLRNERAAFEDPAKVREVAEKAQHEIGTIKTRLTEARNPQEIVSASEEALRMLNRYPPRISSGEYEKMLNDVKDVQEHIDDHARARTLALRVGAALAAAGGIGGAEYLTHRITLK